METERKSKRNKKERRLERELLYIFGFLFFLVILFLIASSVFASFNRIEYEGLVFTKESFGQIPVFHHYYYFKAPTGNLIQYNLYVRNDPTTNSVPIEGGTIRFEGRAAYITLDTSYLTECEDSIIAIADLTKYLADNQINVKSGNMDFVEAAVNKQEYVTCENKPYENVIQILRGDETKIKVEGQCSTITIGPECNILEAIEKFKIHAYLDAQQRDRL